MTEEVNAALKAMPFLIFYFSRVNLSIFSWNFYSDCTVWYQWVAMREHSA